MRVSGTTVSTLPRSLAIRPTFDETVHNLGGLTLLYETVAGFDVPLRAMSGHPSVQPRV
jgi:hypothetical protein